MRSFWGVKENGYHGGEEGEELWGGKKENEDYKKERKEKRSVEGK